MHKTLIKRYASLYPSIDLSKGFLSDDDKLTIVTKKLPNLNPNSEKIKIVIRSLPSDIRSSQRVFREFMEAIGDGNPGSSIASVEYWLKMGWDEDYARVRISEEQRRRSKRCVEYWIANGYSAEEAMKQVSLEQSVCSKRWINGVSKPKSILQIQFWVDRGFSLEEAVSLISEKQRKNAVKNYTKYNKDQLRKLRPVCIEYWQERYPDNSKEMFELYLSEKYKSNMKQRSKIADEFCEELSNHFTGCKIYYKENEFGKYIHGVGYRKYDYIDITNMVCVEFHGDYWHKENDENDLLKKDFIESLGFRYFVVWESEYRKDKLGSLRQLLEKINA